MTRKITPLLVLWTATLGLFASPGSASQGVKQRPVASSGGRGVASRADLNSILAKAISLYSSGDLEGAVREYQAYLVVSPGAVGVRSNLGVTLAHLGRYGEAIEQYKKALAGDVRSLTPAELLGIRFNLAVAYYQSGEIPQAARKLAQLQAAQPQNLRLALLLADCHFRMGEYQQVIKLLSPFHAANPQNDALIYLLGMSFLRNHEAPQGEAMIDPILRNGDSAPARILLGAAALEDLKFEAAEKDFEQAIELDPGIPSAHSLLGLTYMRMGAHEKALAAFRKEVAIDPNDFESNFYLGALLKEDQNYAESLRYVKRALQIRPDDAGAEYQLGTLYLEMGNFQAARAVLEKITRSFPAFTEAHVSLAMVYYRLKDKQDGDRERAIVQKLNAAAQAQQPAVKAGQGNAYRGQTPSVPKPQ